MQRLFLLFNTDFIPFSCSNSFVSLFIARIALPISKPRVIIFMCCSILASIVSNSPIIASFIQFSDKNEPFHLPQNIFSIGYPIFKPWSFNLPQVKCLTKKECLIFITFIQDKYNHNRNTKRGNHEYRREFKVWKDISQRANSLRKPVRSHYFYLRLSALN